MIAVAACYCRGSQPGHVRCVVDVRTSLLASRIVPGWAPYRTPCVVCVGTSSLSSFGIDGFDILPRSMCGLRSHVIAVIACYCRVSGPVATTIAMGNVYTNCPPIGPTIARDVWSVSTSSLSSFGIDGFDILQRSMCGLRSHVIAVISWYCRVSGPVATIAVRNIRTDCHRIGPNIARDVWSVLARHRYLRLSLTGSTSCRARCVVFVRMSSLSSHVIVGFPALSLLLSP